MKNWIRFAGLGCAAVCSPGLFADDVEWRAVGTSPKKPTIQLTAAQEPPVAPPLVPPEAPQLPKPATADEKIAPPSDVLHMPAAVPAPPPAQAPASIAAQACQGCKGPLINDSTVDCGEGAVVWSEVTSTPIHRFWVRGEYLAWFLKSSGMPALLTTSAAPFPFTTNAQGTPILDPAQVGQVGAIGNPSTVVLLGGNDLDEQFRPGVRISAGFWFDPCATHGVDASVFLTQRSVNSYGADTNSVPILTRPFFAPNTGFEQTGGVPAETSELVGAADIGLAGRLVFQTKSVFGGGDINYRRCIAQRCFWNADGFVGFRYLNLGEQFDVQEMFVLTRDVIIRDSSGDSLVPAGTRADIYDRFATRNNFYGGQIGTNVEFNRDKWSLNVRSLIGIGTTCQQLSVVGNETESFRGTVTGQFTGGTLALDSNIGNRSRNKFTYVPEINLRVGYNVNSHLRLTVGYDFLYWSSVVRPGDQIDRTLDIVRIPPPGGGTPVEPPRPAPLFQATDFWAQGANMGLEYRW